MAALTATRRTPPPPGLLPAPHRRRQAGQGGPRRLPAPAARARQRPLPHANHLGSPHALTLDTHHRCSPLTPSSSVMARLCGPGCDCSPGTQHLAAIAVAQAACSLGPSTPINPTATCHPVHPRHATAPPLPSQFSLLSAHSSPSPLAPSPTPCPLSPVIVHYLSKSRSLIPDPNAPCLVGPSRSPTSVAPPVPLPADARRRPDVIPRPAPVPPQVRPRPAPELVGRDSRPRKSPRTASSAGRPHRAAACPDPAVSQRPRLSAHAVPTIPRPAPRHPGVFSRDPTAPNSPGSARCPEPPCGPSAQPPNSPPPPPPAPVAPRRPPHPGDGTRQPCCAHLLGTPASPETRPAAHLLHTPNRPWQAPARRFPDAPKTSPAQPQEFFGKNSYCARGPRFSPPAASAAEPPPPTRKPAESQSPHPPASPSPPAPGARPGSAPPAPGCAHTPGSPHAPSGSHTPAPAASGCTAARLLLPAGGHSPPPRHPGIPVADPRAAAAPRCTHATGAHRHRRNTASRPASAASGRESLQRETGRRSRA